MISENIIQGYVNLTLMTITANRRHEDMQGCSLGFLHVNEELKPLVTIFFENKRSF